jgi:hypothetical protein
MDRTLSRRQAGKVAAASLAAALVVPASIARADTTPLTRWYFAEGYTGDGFDTFLCIMNPTPTTATVRLTYFLGEGNPVVKGITVPPNARETVPVHDSVLGVGRGQAVSSLVERTDGGGSMYVERPMYFTFTHPEQFVASGGHNVMGTTEPRSTWYFAEGYTGPGFDEFLTIMNPNSTDAYVRITYYLTTGGAPIVKELTARANRRETVVVHDTAVGVGRQPSGVGVSAKVESLNNVRLVVERPMYFTYGPGWTDGHNVMGTFAPNTTWYFADGSTETNRDMYLTINNPDPTYPATIQLTYYFATGTVIIKEPFSVSPNTRYTVAVYNGSMSNNADLGIGRGQPDVAVKVESINNVGIVAERPIYFDYNGWTGGHTVVGAPAPQNIFFFAEGYTGIGFDEFLVILNPTSSTASVKITYFLEAGPQAPKTISVGPKRRKKVAVFDTPANNGVGRGLAVAAKVESDRTIVVERPIYFTYGAGWTGGHTIVGFPASYL